MTDLINEESNSSQLPVTITVCISVNIYNYKPYISLCYSFLVLQGHNPSKEETKGLTKTLYHTRFYQTAERKSATTTENGIFYEKVEEKKNLKSFSKQEDKQSWLYSLLFSLRQH